MIALEDTVGAFVPGSRADVSPLANGVLSGVTFAASDLWDVAGLPTSFGNPSWAEARGPARSTAPAILSLLQAGAWMVGKTILAELGSGLTGENAWYATPRNPRAPDRFPGGASGGAAAAVAARLVDLALAVDTAGSVLMPASYCGLFGMRASAGAISVAGAEPAAPSLDSCGWLAAKASVLARAGDVLLPGGARGSETGPLLRVEEAWVNAEPDVARVLHQSLAKLAPHFGRPVGIQLAPEGLDTFYDHFRSVLAEEIWATLGDRICAQDLQLGPGPKEAFAAFAAMDPALAAAGRAFRRMVQARIAPLLAGGAVLVYATSPCPAPLLAASGAEQDAVREASLGVTSFAGLCGLPEATVPVGAVRGAPVGLSFTAGRGWDRALLAFVQEAATILGLPA